MGIQHVKSFSIYLLYSQLYIWMSCGRVLIMCKLPCIINDDHIFLSFWHVFTRPVIMSLVHGISSVINMASGHMKVKKRKRPCILHGQSQSRYWECRVSPYPHKISLNNYIILKAKQTIRVCFCLRSFLYQVNGCDYKNSNPIPIVIAYTSCTFSGWCLVSWPRPRSYQCGSLTPPPPPWWFL